VPVKVWLLLVAEDNFEVEADLRDDMNARLWQIAHTPNGDLAVTKTENVSNTNTSLK